jgi:putative membrane protein
MRKLAFTAAVMMVATSALAQSATEKTGVNSLLGVAPKTEDFLKEASMSDIFEIASSNLALERADGATKTFAQQMVHDHQKTTMELKQLIDSGKVKAAPASSMSDDQKDSLDSLTDLQGSDFTKQYQEDQVEAHKDAVDLFKRYAEGGDNADLKTWASSTLPTLQHHLEMAQEMAK